MTRPPYCRRKSPRLGFPEGETWEVEFSYPVPGGIVCRMPLRDLSTSGTAFRLTQNLPDLEFGCTIQHATLTMNGRKVNGDMLVMHLTPDDLAGSICGVLFYPATDKDVIVWREALVELESKRSAA
jgi:hypothetical protein